MSKNIIKEIPVLGLPDTTVPTVEPPKLSFGVAEIPPPKPVAVCCEDIVLCPKPGVAAAVAAGLPVPNAKFVIPV